jgi:hypothetical protein
MPVDKPKPGETQEEYLQYCIPEEINGGMERDQAVAVCISKYDAENMSAQTPMNITELKSQRNSFMKHIKIK